jgi:type IV secretory pathway TrbD component
MSILRQTVAIIGLLCIVLFYFYQNAIFLGIAIVLFAVGLFLMGAFKKPRRVVSRSPDKKNTK